MKETVRRRRLPEGWYPDTEHSVISTIKDWEQNKVNIKGNVKIQNTKKNY